MNPYVFLVGCPRSGTSLVQRLANAHPELAVINETRWIVDWYAKRMGLTPEGDVAPVLLERLREHPRFAKLGIDQAAVDGLLAHAGGPVTYRDFITSLFDLYGEQWNKRLVGDKTPRYVRSIPTLHELWPHAKFVHLIRDGRNVCLSILDWRKGATKFSTWDDDAVSTTALYWDWNVRLGQEAGALLGPDRYFELRYEALVGDAQRGCNALCEFLGLRYDGAMLRFHEGRVREKPGRAAKKAWLPVTPGLRSWESQLPAAAVARFEAAAGRLLDELGYARGATLISDDAVARATRLRETFADEALTRGAAVPAAWRSVAA